MTASQLKKVLINGDDLEYLVNVLDVHEFIIKSVHYCGGLAHLHNLAGVISEISNFARFMMFYVFMT